MKTQAQANVLARVWRRLMASRAPAHDPLLSLSMNLFNFSSGWDRLLAKQRQFGS